MRKSFKMIKRPQNMKLALSIILIILVAISHQQYFGHPPMVFVFPWLLIPFPNRPVFHNVYDTVVRDTVKEMIPIRTGLDSRNDTVAEEEEFPDTQSRSKGFNKFRPPTPVSLENQQEGRFFYNFGNNNNGNNKLFNIYNPFLKTSTFTLTLTVTTISSVVTCVPSFQFLGLGIPAPPVCVGRKKRQLTGEEESDDEVDQFPVVPSETLKLMPTAIPSLDLRSLRENRLPDVLTDEVSVSSSEETNFQRLTSSQGEDIDQGSTEDRHIREGRFLYVNRNIFVVSSTTTTYIFVPTVLTTTINLVTPVPNRQCARTSCAKCIPPGYIICPAD